MAIRVDDVDLVRDRELVARHQAGDASAFADLYQRYFARLKRFCQRQVGDAHVAEELAQEAFTRALRALPRFAGERRFYPWMTVIARRLCIDHQRERARVTATADLEPGVHDEVNRAIDARADGECLDEALDNVRRRHREVLRLRDWENLSYEEIAGRLRVPATTVPPLLHRARQALRREFLALVDTELLAAVPIVGAVVRLAQRRRQGFLVRAGAHGPEAGGLGASIAAALGTVAVVVPGLLAPGLLAPDARTPDPAPAAVVAGPSVADAEAPTTPPPAVQTPGGDDLSPPRPGTDIESDAVVVGPASVQVGPEGADRTRDSAEQQPVSDDLGPVFVGLNPAAASEDVDRITHRLRDLGGAP